MRKGLLVAAFTFLLVLGLTSVVQALPPSGQGHDYIFYSDDTFTTAVGERYMDCDGVPYNWGVRSAYEYADQWDCATFESIFGGCYSGFYYCPDDFYPNDPCHCF